MNIQDLVGKRCLLKVTQGWRNDDVSEFRVLEVSPSGNWVKLQNLNGYKFWKAVSDVAYLEELRDFKAERAAEVG